jgi:hypothetical protein
MYENMHTFRQELERREKIMEQKRKEENEKKEKVRRILLTKETRQELINKFLSGETKTLDPQLLKMDANKLASSTEGKEKQSSRKFNSRLDDDHFNPEMSPEEKMKILVNKCIDRLVELDIQILWLNYDLTAFGQNEWFERQADLLTILCVKNGCWFFEADLMESDDCAPGIFRLRNVENLATSTPVAADKDSVSTPASSEISSSTSSTASASNVSEEKGGLGNLGSLYCDLFCKNTDETLLQRIMSLFNEKNVDDFMKKNYGKWYSFHDDLRNYLATSRENDIKPLLKKKKIDITIGRFDNPSGRLVEIKLADEPSTSMVVCCSYIGTNTVKIHKKVCEDSTYRDRFLYTENRGLHSLVDFDPTYQVIYNGPEQLPEVWRNVYGLFRFLKSDYGWASPSPPLDKIDGEGKTEEKVPEEKVPESNSGQQTRKTNADIGHMIAYEIPKSSNDSHFKKEWQFGQVEPHNGLMIDTTLTLTFDKSHGYIINPLVVTLNIKYDTNVDKENCILTVESVHSGQRHEELIPYYQDTRPEEFKKSNQLIEFNDRFSYRGTFDGMLAHMKRISLQLFHLHLKGTMYEGYDSAYGGLDKPYMVNF